MTGLHGIELLYSQNIFNQLLFDIIYIKSILKTLKINIYFSE